MVRSWSPRIKCEDDLAILEVIPRNSPSVMKHLVNDVNSFAHCNNMQLNPNKCKLMRVHFLRYNSCYSLAVLLLNLWNRSRSLGCIFLWASAGRLIATI